VTQASWRSGATELRRELHLLPIRQGVEFKLGVIARKVIYTGTPGYRATAISRQQPSQSLRSSTAPLLHQPYAPSARTHFPLLILLCGIGCHLLLATLLR